MLVQTCAFMQIVLDDGPIPRPGCKLARRTGRALPHYLLLCKSRYDDEGRKTS